MPSHASDRSSSLGIRVLECLSRHPQNAALFFEERVLTCGELAQQSTAFVGALRHWGIQPGERVALLLPNVPEFIPAYVGILCAGAIAVPLDPTSRPPEIHQMVCDAEVTARCSCRTSVLQTGESFSKRCERLISGPPRNYLA